MSENKLTLLETVEKYLGTTIPSSDEELLESCKEEVKFVRHMTGIDNVKLNLCLGQLIIVLHKDKSITTTRHRKIKGNQYRLALKDIDKKKVKRVVLVTNTDTTKRTGSGVWVWDFNDE